MKIAFLMDPLDKVRIEKDTSFILMLAAFKERHLVYYITSETLSYREGSVFGECQNIEISDDRENPFIVRETKNLNLAGLDCIWVRKDPPFNRRYFYDTLLLDLLRGQTLVVNAPAALRDWNEKLSALFFPDVSPATLVTASKNDIKKFLEKFSKIVLKPIDGYGGRGIEFLNAEDQNHDVVIDRVTHNGSHKIVVQAFVPEAKDGDKRILIVEGEPIGAILRLAPPGGNSLNNLDQGGKALATELTKKDLALCARLKPELIKNGLFFVGIDLLGDQLTEVNVTSPTGLQELIRFSGVDHHINTIRTLEKKTSSLVKER